MIVHRIRTAIPLIAVTVLTTVLANASLAQAATPIKLTLASQFGQEVNKTEVGKGIELEDICTVASKDECRPGTGSAAPGGFQFAESVAVGPSGDVYVADAGNNRIDEFSASGQFVLMFGWDVNKTKVEKGTFTQQEMNVCTETEIKAKGECRAGVEGSVPGQLDGPFSVAVDPSGDLYVAEVAGSGKRVQKLTPEGQFVLEIGKGVNETKGTNLCTHEEEVKEKVKCTIPGTFVAEPGSFHFESEVGDLLAVGHEGKLYIGDEGRVQEFKETGEFSGEIQLEAGTRVDALAVDNAGELYLTDDAPGTSGNTVREFDATGKEVNHFTVSPEDPGAEVRIRGLALDANGHLAVAANEQLGTNQTQVGSLYEASSAVLLTAFKIPMERRIKGIGFSGGSSGDLYVAAETSQEVLQYAPKLVAALATGVYVCAPGTERETDVTVDCTLSGEVEPEGVADTEASFEWGLGSETVCGLASLTPRQPVAASESVQASLEGLRPNEIYCYRLNVEDENAKSPEPLLAGLASFTTELAAPRLLGEPQTQFVGASSAVMGATLNPENAPTKYYFEYAPGAKALAFCGSIVKPCDEGRLPCSGATRTPLQQSGIYGSIGTTAEAVGLRPSTEYSYRLIAENENEDPSKPETCAAVGSEASFTTATVPSPSAETGGCSVLGSTNAVVYATVTPDGAPVTYSFELGVYQGAATQYGVVSSGSVEPDSGSIVVSHQLTGLQPGTAYAYRISISSGYIDDETHTLQGQSGNFATGGLPAVLSPPPLLAQLLAPPIQFPKVVVKKSTKTKGKGKAPKKKAKHGKKGKKAARRGTVRHAR